jgi:hypothetical protein
MVVHADQAAWEVYQSLKLSLKLQQQPLAQQPQIAQQPRPLKSREHELSQKAAKEATWDEGAITTFVGNPAIQGTAWDIDNHTLVLYATQQDAATHGPGIAASCGKLWNWLGVTRPFTLVLWWRDDPREIAAEEWPSRATVNGGWTSQNSSVIYVYRSEEWDRVFLHEMIHALGWDWKMPEKPLPCWGLPTGSKVVPALFEAWTELYAEWLWCTWHATEYGAWEAQRAWQDEQAKQILARAGANPTWSENTSVFAYYVLKAALAPHIAELLLFGNGRTAEEREAVLCRIAVPGLHTLSSQRVVPQPMTLRMARPTEQK